MNMFLNYDTSIIRLQDIQLLEQSSTIHIRTKANLTLQRCMI